MENIGTVHSTQVIKVLNSSYGTNSHWILPDKICMITVIDFGDIPLKMNSFRDLFIYLKLERKRQRGMFQSLIYSPNIQNSQDG